MQYVFLSFLQTQILASEDAATAQIKCQELQYQGVALCHLLIQEKETWLTDKAAIVDCLKKIWMSEAFHARFTTVRNASVHLCMLGLTCRYMCVCMAPSSQVFL